MNVAADQTHSRFASRSGVRVFFLLGSVFAAVMMGVWLPWFLGLIQMPSAWPPQTWHTHELVLGFAPAVFAGFLLAEAPGATGQRPISGALLILLVTLWLAGRAAMFFSGHLDAGPVAVLSIAFPLVLAAAIARQSDIGGDWRNVAIATMLCGIAAADAFFHYEMWEFGRPKLAHNLALAFVLSLLMILSERVGSAFSRSSLYADDGVLPLSSGRYNAAFSAVCCIALVAWALAPPLDAAGFDKRWIGGLLLIAALASVAAQIQRAKLPLTGFHLAWSFVALGLVLAALGILRDDYDFAAGGQSAWTVGSVGMMALALMAWSVRAGRSPISPATVVLYGFGLVSGLAWTVAGFYPRWTLVLLPVSGFAWIAAFIGFAILNGRILFSARLD